ncbi:MAG: 2-oxoacid:acceptor oxidoreductase subunit alpha, partial [Halanaerobiaceae bacterium]|nr:2-oxoacid:acceptor oxidoreductase subunit alpha [Halanaerobiaceae bacterium]
GGLNFSTIRFSTEKVRAVSDKIDILIALNAESVEVHKDRVKDGGVIFFDGEKDLKGKKMVRLKAGEIAGNINPRVVNTVFLSAVLKYLSLEKEQCEEIIREYFTGDNVQNDNIRLLEEGYKSIDSVMNVEKGRRAQKQVFIDGNSALAMGATAAGLSFYAAYPMSPATGIMNYLAGKQEELGLVVEQAEDEIAAVNMAIGASYSGIRSMTGTSGGGFALMTEAVGLAGMAEIPLVIADVQRPGPATGLPTRTEQGDLLFAINAAQGDFPLMVIAPRNHEDAFRQAFRAFNMADKYRIPVIILSDQYLADSATNVDDFDFISLKNDYHLINDEEIKAFLNNERTGYKPYLLTESGISPGAYPGQIPGEIVLADSDEHDEYGHITEDAETRKAMVEKRARKLEKLINEDLEEPVYLGEGVQDYLLIGWGSTYGPLEEARNILLAEGVKTALLSFSDVWPLSAGRLMQIYEQAKKPVIVVVENNSTGQFSRLMASETGIKADYNILKYDGRPFTGAGIADRFMKEVMGR